MGLITGYFVVVYYIYFIYIFFDNRLRVPQLQTPSFFRHTLRFSNSSNATANCEGVVYGLQSLRIVARVLLGPWSYIVLFKLSDLNSEFVIESRISI